MVGNFLKHQHRVITPHYILKRNLDHMCQSTCCVDWFVDAPICTMQSDAMYKKYVHLVHSML